MEWELRHRLGQPFALKDYLGRFGEDDLVREAFGAVGTVLYVPGIGPEQLPHVPAYEILEKLGEGGQGIVYKARETATGRLVAVKLVMNAELERWGRLRKVAAGLNHPHLVPIEDFVEHGAKRYIVMPLVGSGDLYQRRGEFMLAKTGLSQEEVKKRCLKVAALLEKVARAVLHLHRHDILHRDLKLKNILFDERGEPRVADIGLARRIDESQVHTSSDKIVGTFRSMAPEQMAPHGEEGCPHHRAADVWSLGAILFELIVGHPPYAKDNPEPLVLFRRKTSGQDPTPPSTDLGDRASLVKDLESICMQCLKSEPSERCSGEEFAAALRRYLNREIPPGKTLREKLRPWADLVRRKFEEYRNPHYLARWRPYFLREAATSFVCHVGMFLLVGLHPVGVWLWLWFLALDTGAGFLIWRRLLFGAHDHSPMEQLVAQFWVGADLAAVVLFSVFCPLLGKADAESIGRFYAAYAVLRGLIFFIEGRTCWGRCYLVSLSFFAAAILMGIVPRYAPLLYALLYSGWFIWHAFTGRGGAPGVPVQSFQKTATP
jgi:serine/threonine protein kinase